MKENLKLYSVDFEPIWPVGSCLIILAKSKKKAIKIASNTIVHTNKFTVENMKMKEEGVVVYESGEY